MDANNIAVPSTKGQKKAKLQALANAKWKADATKGSNNDSGAPSDVLQPLTSNMETLVLEASDDETSNPTLSGDKGLYSAVCFLCNLF
jgi:hypothetical protein